MEANMDWTPIITELQKILATVVLAIAVYAGKLLIAYLGRKVQEQNNAALSAVYAKAIAAAEQQFGPGTGDVKREWVTKYLEGRGVQIDRVLLEALVNEITC